MKSLKELMSLKGRTALVTGGAGHLGFVMAEALAEAGANIILLDVDKSQRASKTKAIEKKFHHKAVSYIADLTDDKAVRDVAQKIQKQFGRLDILINCAALVGTSKLKGWAVPFKDQDIHTWRKALEVNLTAIFSLTQACQKLFTPARAAIINISSIYGMVGPDRELYEGTGMGNPAAYSASKGGLLQLTRWLATTLAPDVRVNAITIGGIFRNHKEPFLSRYTMRTPLKRMATEEDLKGAVVYLASDLSSYVTGHNLVVDGGWTSW